MSEPQSGERVALVIPILNEAATLPPLLSAIQGQTRLPDEIVFVDAGSTDASLSVISAWWQEQGWPDGACRVEVNPGGYPGHNRNIGVGITTCEWIAFIDCGIYPEPDWLERLLACAGQTGAPAVFGLCDFFAEGAIAKAACALSYGLGSEHPVLPASLFQRSAFLKTGMFEEQLRAAEDVKWMALLESWSGPKVVCLQARVHYRVFPDSIPAIARKWYLYKSHVIKAGIGVKYDLLQLVVVVGWLIMLSISLQIAAWSVLVYVVLRGMVDPVRRSKQRKWWDGQTSSLLWAPIVALVIDASKLHASLDGYVKRIRG
ncbi:glycosyltransferase family 2 protein [Candidatus Ferrigenium straubiae]|jgi:glycosyltransferase involved in cell wall biosynthesis|uniref:glycosyltransferase family 2 protein n=1 Tax=Candidatus Ferrigenium straubiae TaxID=2919506 RepID=UPI003F4AEB9E